MQEQNRLYEEFLREYYRMDYIMHLISDCILISKSMTRVLRGYVRCKINVP